MTGSDDFYSQLKPFNQFQGICDPKNYTQLPAKWAIVITDIKGSTRAIQQGKYRQVNALGVASMVAIFNALKPLSIPFVFGGDGASLCIPPSGIQDVKSALIETQRMAKENFSLTLRCGIVPNSVILQSKTQVLIGKYQVSEGYYQATFTGNGLSYAEKLVKNDPQSLYCLTPDNKVSPDADFTGFECRWRDVPSPHTETVSLLVLSTANTPELRNTVYLETLTQIQKIYGTVENYRPIQQDYLELSTRSDDLQDEVNIRAGLGSKLSKLLYAWFLPWKVRLGRYWMTNGKQTLDTDWGKYKASLVNNTDFRKFDDNLRMVISGGVEQRAKLSHSLEKQYKKGLLIYGLHVSDRALMTCVISDYHTHHIHFVDGADGGYAMAAKALKDQLKAKNTV